MVRTAQKTTALRKYVSRTSSASIRKKAATFGVALAAIATSIYFNKICVPQPMRTSILTGQLWLHELLRGHPLRFHEQMGMSRHVFRQLSQELQLYNGLKDSKHVTADEQLAIFIHLARTGQSSRMLQERFQRSGDTISTYIHKTVKMLIGNFYRKHVHQLLAEQTPNEILKNPKLYPYFKDCRGAIDGSHFHAYVQAEAAARYRNRKGGITQNVLAASDFDLKFIYLLSGWEGSAADSRIFEYARSKDLAIPQNCYYLADAGFPICDALMTPYRGKRYHLKEWARGNQKPRDYQELFNLRHAQARNVVERIFGVFKRRFALMEAAPEYSAVTQARFIPALAGIHNFIDPLDKALQRWEEPSTTREIDDSMAPHRVFGVKRIIKYKGS